MRTGLNHKAPCVVKRAGFVDVGAAKSFNARQSKAILARFLRFFEIALVLVRFDHVAGCIANANDRIG
jgi:hypothetical protein